MDEYQKNQIINSITRAVVKTCMDVIKEQVKKAIQENAILNELFKQRG